MLSENDFLQAIPETIKAIESYDVTSVRASVGNYLVAKYISEHTNCKVVLNGDYSDEVTGGYIYLHSAPSLEDFDEECKQLVNNICYFDSLRSDRCLGAHGLEGRMPFSDKQFIHTYWSILPELRKHKVEKYLLRKAFDGMNLLPDEVLWRQKEAFSDGVSNSSRSWKTIIHDHVLEQVSYREYKENNRKYTYCHPPTIEAYFYRSVYESFYRNEKVIPYFWMPKWADPKLLDPSARELPQYKQE
jgi:asparagine synthase (glutamine-hydrolysing)